jgi:hypothetical protein
VKNEKYKAQSHNLKLKTKRKILNFELWFLAFLPVRCLTASVLAQAGTQTGRFSFSYHTLSATCYTLFFTFSLLKR